MTQNGFTLCRNVDIYVLHDGAEALQQQLMMCLFYAVDGGRRELKV